MKFEIELGTKYAICLALCSFVKYSEIVMKEPIEREELACNIERITYDEHLQKYWLEKWIKELEKGKRK